MTLKAEVSIPIALTTATVVYGVYSASLPSVAESRTSDVNDDDLRAAENVASWTAAAVIAGVSLLTRDPLPFILGGTMLVGMAWIHRHARMVDPSTGRVQLGAPSRYIHGEQTITPAA